MTTILDPAADLALAPLTNTPLTSTATTFELADQAGDISAFPDPGSIGYYAWVWAREPNYPNVGDANRAGFAERVRVTARDVGAQELTVTRGGSPIDLNASGVTYWLVAPMNADYIDKIDERLFDFSGGELSTTKDTTVPTLYAEQIDLAVTTPGVGLLRFLEDTANGTSAVTLQSPASLAGNVAITLLDTLPGSTEYLQISSAGVISTTSTASNPVTLDDAYDEGGAGAGRVVTGDTGPVEVTGAGGFQSTHTDPLYLYETTSASVYNWRTRATSGDLFNIDRGDQDADVSDDTFETILSLDGSNRRVGINTTSAQDTLHVLESGSGSARIRLDTSVSAQDASIAFFDNGTAIWEAGYDNSINGFVVGRLTFTNPILFIEDTTGYVGIGTTSPSGICEIYDNGTTTALTVTQIAAQIGAFINQDGNQAAFHIDSEATGFPLIDLDALDANTRGDISFGSNRTAAPSSPSPGDIWYDSTLDRFEARCNGVNRPFATRFGVHWGSPDDVTISSDAATVTEAWTRLTSESGVSDNLQTITASAAVTGDQIIISNASSHTITVKTGLDNILCDGGADKTLNNNDLISFIYDGTNWRQFGQLSNLA